ncbi:hypothetical protein [Pelagicoccus sp. SDUM812005]|uniref:hypothetical protein n=1 Tax=Pelagicoccus sp. SDUM812005 TaxID=3041257 RepID=UPI00280D8D58|nr:hypothetical protein [Pelagicoccus sp. SDUM812005]MDQ8183315.1 hypothetical protein [Pelagicoccus sp. SDUM812005]
MIPITNYKKGLNALCASAFAGAALAGGNIGYAQDDDGEEEVFELSPFTVDGADDDGYRANSTLAGGRLKTQLSDVATSVQVMTSEFLEDVGATGMDEVLLYATNADAVGRGSDYMDTQRDAQLEIGNSDSRQVPMGGTNIRGLGRATRTVDYYVTEIPFDSYISGRVDINRGANSFLFGLGSPGGIVNRSTNTASLSRDSTKFEFQLSTENFEDNHSMRASINHNKVLIEDQLAVRVATLFNEEEYTQKPAMKDTQRNFVAFTYKPFSEKKITIKGNFENGNIVSNPANRLGPLENLSTFLNDPRDTPIVWPKTEENPTGRMWVNAIETINAMDGDSLSWHNYLGLDDNGVGIRTWGNSTGAPVGRGWTPVFDGTETADGHPTWAFALQTRGEWINGNPTFDADDGFVRGSRNSIFTGPPGYRNLGSNGGFVNWSDQGLTNYDVFDWRTNLISGGLDFTNFDFDRSNVSFEMLSDSGDYGIELGFDKQHFDRESYISIGNPRLTFDVNETLPMGQPNPNFGRLYIYTGVPTRTYAPSTRETMRATAFAKVDFEEKFDSPLGKLLGRHTLTGLLDSSEEFKSTIGYTMGSEGGDVAFHVDDTNVQGNNRRARSIIYLGPQQLDAWSDPNFSMADFQMTSVPGNLALSRATPDHKLKALFWNVGDPATDANYRSVRGDEFPDETEFWYEMRAQNAKLEQTNVDSWAINLQSFFFNDLLVANLGWRDDEVENYLNSSPPKDEVNVSLVSPDVFNLDDTEARTSGGSNFAYGLVLKVPNNFLPEGHTMALHYGDSSNFTPSPDGFDIDGNLTPPSDGSTKDYGVTYSTDRFSIRFNAYKGNSTNLGSGAGAGAGFGYGVVASQAMMNIYRDTRRELDDWDWDMDGQFDDPTVDDGLNDDGEPEGIAGDGIIDSKQGNNPMSLAQLHQLHAAWGELVTPFMKEVTRYSYTPSSAPGESDDSWVLGSDLYYVLKDTIDLEAEGKEIELTFNPTKNWRIAFNATQQSSIISNSYARIGEFGRRYAAALDKVDDTVTPDGEVIEIEYYRNSGNFLEDTPRTDKYGTNALYGKYFGNSWGGQLYLYGKALEGTEDPKVREYRANFITNYKFSDGRFKGLNVGGAYRYQSEGALGFELIEDPETGTPYPDPDKPHYDDSREYFDFWAGYSRKISGDRVNWKVQLNVRNAFADNDPLPAQFQPDGSVARASVPAPRQIILRNTFEF